MQTRARQITCGITLILAAGCAGQQVTTDYSPAASFSQYRTYALVLPPDTAAAQQLLDQRVSNAVQAQLNQKGLTETDRQKADLFVGYGIVDRTHRRVYSYDNGWGWGRGWGWRYYRWGVAWPMTTREIETYTDGTVVVHLIDAKTKKVVWEGQVPGALSLPVDNPSGATKDIDGAVAKLFAKYPPQTSPA
jgi:hypothetical protein